jgi:hypothetical protein
MKDFIDETSTVDGTPINRANLMAVQGFIGKDIEFKEDGSIVETNSNGEKLTTVFNSDGSIMETFVGEKTINKKTTFSGNKILEVLT